MRSLFTYMLAANETRLLPAFRGNTLALDRLRRQDTAATCPKLAPLLRWPRWYRLRHRLAGLLRRLRARRRRRRSPG